MLYSNIHTSTSSPKLENSVLVYLERKQVETDFVVTRQKTATVERLDMPHPDALAMALLEQYPDHASKMT
jgi:hypothetical protein